MEKKTKIAVAVSLIFIVILAAGGYVYFWKAWWPAKQMKIQFGLAQSNFPWFDYSQEELNQMYPQIKYADVPTRVTPEETYAKFREALKTNNLELALAQLSQDSSKYAENKAVIEKAYEEGRFSNVYKEYLENLEKSYMYESIAQYYFIESSSGKKTNYPINFIKDANGDWKMDSL